MILVIDNYDSFTYNLVQYLGELGADLVVYRNDQISLEEIADIAPEKIVISPGPCTPNEAGISVALVQHFHHSGGNSDFRGLSGASVHRAGIWWKNCGRADDYAREGVGDSSYEEVYF